MNSFNIATLYRQHFKQVLELHQRAFELLSFKQLIISSGFLHSQFNDDTDYPFKVNPYFKYWLPLCQLPNCFIIVDAVKTPRLLYFQPDDFWSSWQPLQQCFWSEAFDCEIIQSAEQIATHLNKDLNQTVLLGERGSFPDSLAPCSSNPQALLDLIDYQRSFKTAYEHRCMIEANKAGALAHQSAKQAFMAGASEFEVHLAYLQSAQCSEHLMPYDTIIGFNQNAAILHYHPKQNASKGRSMLIDAGVQYNGYASDITRTYSAKNDDFDHLIDQFDQLQQSIVANIKVGINFQQLHEFAIRQISQFMIAHDFINCSLEQCIDTQLYQTFFPHGLGHFIGLQVHDVAGYNSDERGTKIPANPQYPTLRMNRTLEHNQSFTIEPGCYFIDSLLAKLQASEHSHLVNWQRIDYFKPYGGIRIEDNVFIGSDGVIDNMTRSAMAGLD